VGDIYIYIWRGQIVGIEVELWDSDCGQYTRIWRGQIVGLGNTVGSRLWDYIVVIVLNAKSVHIRGCLNHVDPMSKRVAPTRRSFSQNPFRCPVHIPQSMRFKPIYIYIYIFSFIRNVASKYTF